MLLTFPLFFKMVQGCRSQVIKTPSSLKKHKSMHVKSKKLRKILRDMLLDMVRSIVREEV